MYNEIGYYLSFFGDPRLWIVLSVLVFLAGFVAKRKGSKKLSWTNDFVLFVGVPMGLSFLLSYGLKELFQIPRPLCSEINPYCEDSFSFPSGHSTTAFAGITGLVLMLKSKKHLWLYAFALLTAWGRLLLGVHTIQDIAFGATIGIVFSIVYRKALLRFLKNSFAR